MSYEITGVLVEKYDTVQRTETFRTREFVIEKTEQIDNPAFTRPVVNYIKFQLLQDRTTIVDKLNIGDEVKVHFNIKGTKWNKTGVDNYITNLDAWRIEQIKIGQENAPIPPAPNAPSIPTDEADDLPF